MKNCLHKTCIKHALFLVEKILRLDHAGDRSVPVKKYFYERKLIFNLPY